MSKKVILLANLGSPDSPSVKDVRTYLNEFLMDERVIDVPYPLRCVLVKGLIVPFRAPSSAKKYKTIWDENGSPLIHITKQLVKLVGEQSEMPVYMCMRYANPTPKAALDAIQRDHPDADEVVLVPLYPHYAMSSYETAVVHVMDTLKNGNYPFKLNVVEAFYNHPDYIRALSNSMKPFLEREYDHVLFSYHGIPERHVRKTDPTGEHCLKCNDCCNTPSAAHAFCYRHQVLETTRLVAAQLNLPAEKHSFSFQSRLGQDAWLKPFTAQQLKEFPKKGIKKLIILCPAFVSDCLETLEEIQEEGREIFMENGGEEFTLIPCLNLNAEWVKTIDVLVKETL